MKIIKKKYKTYENVSLKTHQAYLIRKKEMKTMSDKTWTVAVMIKEYDDYCCDFVPKFLINDIVYDVNYYDYLPFDDDTDGLMNNFLSWKEYVKRQIELYNNN